MWDTQFQRGSGDILGYHDQPPVAPRLLQLQALVPELTKCSVYRSSQLDRGVALADDAKGHDENLADHENTEPEEGGVGETVGMQADAEHVGAEP